MLQKRNEELIPREIYNFHYFCMSYSMQNRIAQFTDREQEWLFVFDPGRIYICVILIYIRILFSRFSYISIYHLENVARISYLSL